jgi:hypothetical protein
VLRERVLAVVCFVVAVGLGATAFTAAGDWWQTVLLILGAIAFGVLGAYYWSVAAAIARARRVLRSNATPSDQQRLMGLSRLWYERVFRRAGATAADLERQLEAFGLFHEERLREERGPWPCPCCEYLTFDQEPPRTWGIPCAACGWKDRDSLREAQDNFRRIGVAFPELTDAVRLPRLDELPGTAPRETSRSGVLLKHVLVALSQGATLVEAVELLAQSRARMDHAGRSKGRQGSPCGRGDRVEARAVTGASARGAAGSQRTDLPRQPEQAEGGLALARAPSSANWSA